MYALKNWAQEGFVNIFEKFSSMVGAGTRTVGIVKSIVSTGTGTVPNKQYTAPQKYVPPT